jgi:YHS domain-containing protein
MAPAPVKGEEAFSSEYEGAIYRFASKEGKDMFDAKPTQFVPAYGGYCAFGLSRGGLVPVDPLNYTIIGDDRELHLFFKDDTPMDTKPMWEEDEAGNAIKATAHWENKTYKKD